MIKRLKELEKHYHTTGSEINEKKLNEIIDWINEFEQKLKNDSFKLHESKDGFYAVIEDDGSHNIHEECIK